MRSILITGTNRGIGLSFVREYLARGERVFATCRIPAEATRLHELQQIHGDRLAVLPLEVTDPAAIQDTAKRVQQETAALDILINNAGVFFPSNSVGQLRPEALTHSFAVNTIAPVVISQVFLALLQASSSPKVVNVTAPTRPISQLQRTEHHSYMASWYALNALTKMMALELQARGIIVVALWPGYLRTDMNNMAAEATPPEHALPRDSRSHRPATWEQAGCCLLPDGQVFAW